MSKELLSGMLLATVIGCSPAAQPIPACNTTQPSTLDRVYTRYFAAQPTVAARGCALPSCHADNAGGLQFRSASEFYAATVNVKSRQNAQQQRIEPGNPGASYLYRKLAPNAPSERMPRGGPYLDDAALAEIAGWICAGAPVAAPDGGTDAGPSDSGTSDGPPGD